jgi:hypothetical protein
MVTHHTMLLMVLTCAACGGTTEPAGPEYPPPGAPFDPASLRIGKPLYGPPSTGCPGWNGGTQPSQPSVLVDLDVAGTAQLSTAALSPLVARGATVDYRFAFGRVRIAIATAALPALIDSGFAYGAVTVPDSSRHDWRFEISLKQGQVSPDDSIHVVRLGGRVSFILRDFFRLIVADLPDEALPYLRRWDRVAAINPSRIDNFSCTGFFDLP